MLKSAASFAFNRLIVLAAILVAWKFYGANSCQVGGVSIFDQLNRALPGLTNIGRALQ